MDVAVACSGGTGLQCLVNHIFAVSFDKVEA